MAWSCDFNPIFRGDPSVSVCSICLTRIDQVVGDLGCEVFPTECNLRFF